MSAMRHIAQIFLDLDGPLLDGKERHYYCYRTILEKHGFVPIGIDQYWDMKRARGNRRDLLDLSGAGLIYDEFLTEWLTKIESSDALAFDKVQEGAVECLHSWKEQGIRLTLVTMRKKRHALEDQLYATGLMRFLDAVLICDHADGGLGKAAAVRTLSHGVVVGNDALWIGDTEADWEAARSLGCPVVLLTNGLRTGQYLRTLEGALVKPSIESLKGEN